MYYAQITNGVVTAVTETSASVNAPDMVRIESLDVSLLGYSYADGVFTPKPEVKSVAVVTMRQARLALLAVGMLDMVNAAINAQEEPFKSQARIEWDYATEVRRDWLTLVRLRAAVGLTEQQLDNLFIAAAKL